MSAPSKKLVTITVIALIVSAGVVYASTLKKPSVKEEIDYASY